MAKGDYHRTIWFVHTDMIAKSDDRNDVNGRKVLIEKGEIIEFRFYSKMNFRTMDDKFYCVDKDTWLKHCVKIGNIWEKVGFENKAKTEEIWRLGLFDEIKEGMAIYDKWKNASESTTESELPEHNRQ